MPRKKVEPEEETVFVPMEDADVEAVLEQVGATSKYIALTRRNPITKDQDYVGRYDLPIDNLLDHVKEDHGGGKYTGRICDQGGVYRKGITFSIDARFRPALVLPPTAPATATPPSDSGLSEVKDLLKQLITLQMAPKHDPFDVFIKASEIFKPMTPIAPPVQTPAPRSMSEMLAIFR